MLCPRTWRCVVLPVAGRLRGSPPDARRRRRPEVAPGPVAAAVADDGLMHHRVREGVYLHDQGYVGCHTRHGTGLDLSQIAMARCFPPDEQRVTTRKERRRNTR